MASTALDSPDNLLAVLPEQLVNKRRFLLWRSVPHPTRPGKTRKIPVYASGKQRKGLLDTQGDLDQLVSLEEAFDEILLGGDFEGVGFALTGDLGIGAFDLDDCLGADGNLLTHHPGYDLVLEAKEAGAYIEISPSGHGLRIVGPCSMDRAYSKDGLEYWANRRYVTLTGDVWSNPQGWVDLDNLKAVRRIAASHDAPKDPVHDYDPDEVTDETIDELREALEFIDADTYEDWIATGNALVGLGERGYRLWLEWSKTSKKYNKGDEARWETFTGDRSSYASVFAKASRAGWTNPRKGQGKRDARDAFGAEDDEDEDEGGISSPKGFAATRLWLGEQKLYPTEFVIDGFLATGVSVIAGAWGAGKSTNLIPLLASAAHLTPQDWGFWPDLRRKIIWVTEAPDQARDTIYSLAKAEGSASWEDYNEWFHLFTSRRMPPHKLVKEISKLAKELSYELENGFIVNPVIVLDTTTANLDLENESDNSQVGAAMAAVKQSLSGMPVILIGHTPKAVTKSDVGDLTFRGAGAWEAEANATYFLVYDSELDMRYLAIRKSRFTPSYREIDFSHSSGSEIIPTPWGEPQSKTYLHGVPTKSDGSIRKQMKIEAKEGRQTEQKERLRSERQDAILNHIRTEAQAGRVVTRADVRRTIGGKAELVVAALDRLFEAGEVEVHMVTRERLGLQGGGRMPEILLPAEVNLDVFLHRFDMHEEPSEAN